MGNPFLFDINQSIYGIFYYICSSKNRVKTMTDLEKKQIIALVKKEVLPAMGCTEPVAVALCVAKATETLGIIPNKITVYLSTNILKNAMGVGIPGTGMIGLPIAVALGALIGKSEYELEVLKDSTPEAVEKAKQFISEKRVSISLKENIDEKLYVEVLCESDTSNATAIISGGHTSFIYIARDRNVLLDRRKINCAEEDIEYVPELTLRKVYDFALTTPLDDIRFILETARLNKSAAEQAFCGEYGHGLGKMLRGSRECKVLGDTVFSHILSYTSAACDARMAGAMIPVMSNSGSGNQGISATLPVVIYAEENKKTEEELIRALMMSHLTVIYIKQSLGRLSALCGCVVAATGSSCGITWLMGGDFNQVSFAVQNMIANLTGMICDGAKPSCALKVASGVATAVLSAMMAMENKCVTSVEGIIDEDVDQSIRNLTKIGSQGMNETDKMVLDIMTNKG